ncbi:MAG TPA: polysaccharide deacetylase family protein [Paludibacteraceae bacterium]|nr:polysaccharide deacetylase family protein [Paludibacteraceae bacterium]
MFIEQPPSFVRLFWKGIWRMKRAGERTVYLTFDDGPCPTTTPQILEILRRYQLKATFFCVGDNVRKYPELFEQIKCEGHHVGNHTMHHLKGFGTSTEDYCNDVAEADAFIHSRLFRPPYGRVKPAQLKEIRKNYTVVMWDVITRDYNPKLSPEKIVRIVKKYARNGSIIVFHDSKKSSANTLSALPQAIEALLVKGFSFSQLQ